MKMVAKVLSGAAVAVVVAGLSVYALAQHGPGFGPGRMGMMGMGHGTATMTERQGIHDMFMSHEQIRRTVTNLPNGIRTVTESDDPELAAVLASHVAGMIERVKEAP